MVRCALTQTTNAYPAMPARREDLAQLSPKFDDLRRFNTAHNLELAAEAKGMGARVVCLGELFPAPFLWPGQAEDALKGPTIKEVCKAAYENALIIIAPLYELDAGKRYSTAVMVDERGIILGRARRIHIAGDEMEKISPGDCLGPVVDTSAGKLAVALGYDRHFEGVVRGLSRAGADIVFSPGASSGAKARLLWEHEFLTDAARHRVFIGGSNRLGIEKPFSQDYFGGSFFAGPDGLKLANLSQHPNLIVSDLNIEALRLPDPSGWNLKRDERPDICGR